jgi:acetyl-CoA carboxylase biotin carboxyl carrier protein
MASDDGADEGTPDRPDEPTHGQNAQARPRAEALPQQPSLVERVKMLAQALKDSDVSELDLTEDGARILIRRQVEALGGQPGRAPGMRSRRATGALGRDPAESPAAQAPQASELGIAIVAPLTGVFYASPSPASPPFVSVGDTVQAGQMVSIVEAMKVFNEIKSEISGTVTAIVAQNGNLVKKGEALIRVKPI